MHFSDSPDRGIIIVSANENDLGKIQYINSSVSEAIGFKERELVGKSLNLLIP